VGQMLVREGKSVYKGIAIGKIYVIKKPEKNIKKDTIENTVAEVKRFESAKAKATGQLKALYEKALRDVGEEEAMIFDVHQMLLEDLDFNEAIVDMINSERVCAEYAVYATREHFAAMFSNMENEYMRGRAADIVDISERLISCLSGTEMTLQSQEIKEPVIILAEDLTPSETVQFEKDKILALVTRKGSANSHTAILARTMNIPSLVLTDVEVDMIYNGMTAIVDGYTGVIYINPEEETLSRMMQKKAKADAKRALLQELIGKETVTKSGQKIHLYANVGSIQDIDAVLENDSEGIGLFRSEFLYLGRDTFPTEEEQFNAYKEILTKMGDRKVIIRTLDIGADKQADYFGIAAEENPALGLRAIRICLTKPEVFKTQLRALYRASVYGRLAIMFPMITSLQEILEIKEIVEMVQAELDEEHIQYENIEHGIMIETPAAAVISDILAPHVDFFSIGTNDLSQYTMAIDRQNPSLDRFFDPHNEAVLRLMRLACENAHRHGAWCGVCGELAADPELTAVFVEMGMDELSVSPAFTLELRKRIREME